MQTDNVTLLQSPDTMAVEDLPDPSDDGSKGGIPIWAIAIMCAVVLVAIPVPGEGGGGGGADGEPRLGAPCMPGPL